MFYISKFIAMLDFKLKMFFVMYRDVPLPTRREFRDSFKKKHGEFQYLEELIIMIEKFQIKKYGTTLARGELLVHNTEEERKKAKQAAASAKRRRLNKG